ncbi:hypothetical protein AAT19DRAFT_13093 [Rhodotorula toruloides]|uniref:Uncharacterized protein n=1 Tax=Rhodotorula toruloides TaxID=5286 RepID=A0A2T0ADI7_RHOTO|nr:hypothetical protein AAT19DRAFT_13093 [Rhodotorula toruloides]
MLRRDGLRGSSLRNLPPRPVAAPQASFFSPTCCHHRRASTMHHPLPELLETFPGFRDAYDKYCLAPWSCYRAIQHELLPRMMKDHSESGMTDGFKTGVRALADCMKFATAAAQRADEEHSIDQHCTLQHALVRRVRRVVLIQRAIQTHERGLARSRARFHARMAALPAGTVDCCAALAQHPIRSQHADCRTWATPPYRASHQRRLETRLARSHLLEQLRNASRLLDCTGRRRPAGAFSSTGPLEHQRPELRGELADLPQFSLPLPVRQLDLQRHWPRQMRHLHASRPR